MARRGIGSKQSTPFEEVVINLTPLIDVVFVILIVFILVAPLLETDKVELAESAAGQGANTIAVQHQSPITIHVHMDNSIWFEGQQVLIGELAGTLAAAKQRHPGVTPQLIHDRRAQFGIYQSIKNAAEIAGFPQMDVILRPG